MASAPLKPGGLFTALGVLIVLGGMVWWFNKHPGTDAKSSKTPASPKLISVDTNQIQDIHIAKLGAEPIELARVGSNWVISKPQQMSADVDTVNMLAGSLATLNADRVIDEHPSSLDTFGLTTPSEEVDVTVKGGKTTKLLIGADTPSSTGTYAKLESDPKVYTIPSYTKSGFDKSLNDLRDKRLLTFNQDKLTSVTIAGKGAPTEFNKNGQGDWQIVKPKPMRADSLQVDDLIRKLKEAKMDLTGPNTDPKDAAKEYASGEKVGTASTTDNTGTQTIEVHKAKDNAFYAKTAGGTYKMAGDLGDALSKSADDYRNKKLFDFGFNDPTKLEINGTTYQKSGDKWTSGSQTYEAGSIQTTIDKLRDLSATRFIDKMGGAQVMTLGITSGDNHRHEKVTINKDGDMYDAQREGEPSVYVIDQTAYNELQKAIAGIKVAAAKK